MASTCTWPDRACVCTDDRENVARHTPAVTCAWCVGFVPSRQPGASHGICPTCSIRLYQQQRQRLALAAR